MGGGRVVAVHGTDEWRNYQRKASAEGKILVADFTASWCGPCRMIAPVFEKLSSAYTNSYFLKVDIDENEELASEYGVRGVPAFHVYSGGKKVEEIIGANASGLEAAVKKYHKDPVFQGQGRTLGSPSSYINPESSPTPTPPQLSGTSTWDGVDETKPTTTIQIRLGNGSRLVGKFNLCHTVGHIKTFIRSSGQSVSPSFQLQASYPPKVLTNEVETIEDAGLANAVVMVK